MTLIEHIARWAAELGRVHGAAATENARQVIEDGVACMVAGAGDEAAAAVRKGIAGWGTGASTVIGSASSAAAPWAALANGAAGHALDFDDTFLPAVNHASAVMVAALFALGEETGASGADVIDAYIVGLETTYVLARGTMRSHYDIGWHTTSTLGCVGAAAACARLLRLDEGRFAHALSLSVSMSGGMKVQFGTMAKPLHAGLAAQHAVQAARLAEAGVQGRLEALEGPMGLLALCGGPAAKGWDDVIAGIGKAPLAIEARGLMVKRFPCCASTHRVLDCLLELRREEGFSVDEVEAVDTFIGYGNARNLMYSDPRTELQARFSMQYCVAVALTYGTVRLEDFTPQAVARPEIRERFGMTSVTAYDPTEEQKNTDAMRPHRVEVRLKDGRTFSRERDLPKGTLKYPLSEADREAKFRDCCEGFLPVAGLQALHAGLAGLPEVAGVGELTAHLKFQAGSDKGARFLARKAAAVSPAA